MLWIIWKEMDSIANKSKKSKYQRDSEFQSSVEEDKVHLMDEFMKRDNDDGSKDSIAVVGYSKVPEWRMNFSIDERNRIYNPLNH